MLLGGAWLLLNTWENNYPIEYLPVIIFPQVNVLLLKHLIFVLEYIGVYRKQERLAILLQFKFESNLRTRWLVKLA